MAELSILLTELFAYFIFAGTAYYIFYILFKKVIKNRIIQKKLEKKDKILDEIKYSLSTIFIFTFNFAVVYHLQEKGYTRHYSDVSEYGVFYLFVSAALMIVLHDTYFYWGHRLMHHPLIYRYVHLVHHKSTNPSPWAAYAFHPLEAFVEIGILYVIVFTIPYNEISIAMWWTYMLLLNVMGHLGIEVFPANFLEKGILKWHNSPTHHNMHHKYFNYNYGLYFNVWDNLMKTVHPKYYETFAEVTNRGEKLELSDFWDSLKGGDEDDELDGTKLSASSIEDKKVI